MATKKLNRENEQSIVKTLGKQIRLQDKMENMNDIGYLPSLKDVWQLQQYENETGIIIRNPSKKINESTGMKHIDSRCPEGYVFVSAHKKSDGTYIRSFCRKRGVTTEIPARYAYRENNE